MISTVSGVTRVIVVATAPGALAVVGGLPLAVRAVLTLRELGVSDVAVVAGAQGAAVAATLGRRGLTAAADGLSTLAASAAPTLVVAGDVLFDGTVLAPLLASVESDRARVVRMSGAHPGHVWAALCPGAVVTALVSHLRKGAPTLDEAWKAAGPPASVPIRHGEGLCLSLDADHPASALTDALLRAQAQKAAGSDGYLAALLDRHLSRFLTRRLLERPVTPNQITIVSIIVGLAGALGLATVSYAARLAGVLALLASSVLDGVDGELARARREQSPLGARLDLAGDYMVNLAAFVGLGVGLGRQGLPPHGLKAAMILLVGVGVAMVTMHALFNRPALRVSDDLHAPRGEGGFTASPVAAVVEKIAGRDYTYFLLVAAVAGRLEWFLYAAAAGAWAFVASLLAYFFYRRKARTTAA
jgi:phosphatidylglycerophosphate synthase